MQFPLRLLSAEEMRAIHHAALRVLADTGMLVDHDGACEILAAAGARADHATKRVRFPPELVEAKLELVPRETVYHGRSPEFDFTLSVGGPIYSRVAGGATNYIAPRSASSASSSTAWRRSPSLAQRSGLCRSLGHGPGVGT